MFICAIIAIGIFDALLIIACHYLETEEDRRIDDEAQMAWLKEWRNKHDSKQKERKSNRES